MKVLLISFAALCLLAACRGQGEEEVENPITDEQAQCILDALREAEINSELAGEAARDFADTITGLFDHFQRCEAILSDPPTALEQRRHELCRLTWYATVLYELNRIRNIVQGNQFIEHVIVEVTACRLL